MYIKYILYIYKYIYIFIYILYIYIYIYISICIYFCVCVCVLSINGGTDAPGFPRFASIRHCTTIIFNTRKTLYLKRTPW